MSNDSDELRIELQRAVSPRYQVGEEIGRGGMSYVYRGVDSTDGRPVAFKVLRSQYVAALGATRFLREIRLLSQLRHPGILGVLDSGHTETLFYFVMPLAEGETLEARLDREPQLPIDVVRRIVSQVAAALDYAHDTHVIHRDIKPSNLFLCGDQTLVADFGIAKDLTPANPETTTSTGLILGTALYMSPEQADANHSPDRRTDVYSLGCVAYQMVVGEPPFSGPNAQAVLARHRSMPAPSARLFRPELPLGVDAVIRKALAKSPADRYQRAGDFADALSDPVKLMAAAREAQSQELPPVSQPAWRRWGLPAVAGLALIAAAAAYLLRPGRPLDPNKVLVFPMEEVPREAGAEGAGVEVALMIGSALEYTEPFEWIDGLPRLDARQRHDVSLLTASDARRITQAAGAKWYLDGTLVRRKDSVTVVLRLNDAGADSVAGRASATRPAPQAAQAGLDAVNQILPRLLTPGQRMGDLSALADRSPAAVTSWLQGEREYRRFNFAAALEFERRAIAMDSSLAVAALRGAQAASWINEDSAASALAAVALRHAALLPPRMVDFARGLDAYLRSRADSAVQWLGLAIKKSPQWTEAHMALGEVYYHLLPEVTAPLDSLAEVEFTQAAADTGFTPPYWHLAEIAIRRGPAEVAKKAADDFLRRSQDDQKRNRLFALLSCVQKGRTSVNWRQLTAVAPLDALRAAKTLAVAGEHPGCAEDGFRAVFDNSQISLEYRWGAFLGLQGLLAAEGRVSDLRALVDSATVAGLFPANQVYLLDALAGADLATDASRVADSLSHNATAETPPYALWLVGAWRAKNGDVAGTKAMRSALAIRADSTKEPWIARFVEALGARLALLGGDTTTAIGRLRGVMGAGRRDELEWGLGEALAPDRLLLAELLLARGQPAEAMATAAAFDHQAPVAFLPFLPASLVVRQRAAVALGRDADARRFQDRLTRLGQGGESVSDASPSSNAEAP